MVYNNCIPEITRLIDIKSPQGRVFYALVKKPEGAEVGELAKDIGIRLSQLIPILIEMFEKGLVKVAEEGTQIEDDTWVISPDIQIPVMGYRTLLSRIRNLKRDVSRKVHEIELEGKHRLQRT